MSDKTAKKDGHWQNGIKYLSDIDNITQLAKSQREGLKKVINKYPFFANNYYLSLINWKDPDDPIKRLIIPDRNELNEWGRLDASNEKSNTVVFGVQHKYASTALLLVNENCAGFCRYCFRKRLFIFENKETSLNISAGLDYIRRHPEINNVLVTGGDPLMLPTRRLENVISELQQVAHIKIVRIGSKIPAYNPFRILDDPSLLKMFRKYSSRDRRIYLMCHFDHPNELTDFSREAIFMIQKAGVICANQNPIIRGISDDPDVMSELWNELSYIGIPQYYVFQSRPTAGNEPFAIPIVEAYFNIEKAKLKCSGLAKRIRFVMSHESGKVEIVGIDSRFIYMKYHRAKHSRNENRFFICHRNDNAYWLDQLKPVNRFKNDFGRFDYSKTFDFESFDLNKSKAETYHRNLFWPHD